jgi:thiamine pyrophosphate-dependent acetolactate synthase large subunit-like protein
MAMQKGHVHHYPDGAAETAKMHLGSRLNGFDYDALGAHFGLHGQRIDQAENLKAAIENGLKTVQGGTTTILNVMVSK